MAQPLPISRFDEWEAVRGVPGPSATAVVTDRDGFTWIGSHAGLSRTDGHRVETHRPDASDTESLINGAVNMGTLLTARDGTLWIGTEGGLCRRRPTSTRFVCRAWRTRDHHNGTDVVAVTEDEDGTIWAGTTTRGLIRVDPATLDATRVGRSDLYTYVSALASGGDGTLWVGMSRGLAVRRPRGGPFVRVTGVPADAFVIDILVTGQAVWVATHGHGLFQIVEDDAARPVDLGVSTSGYAPQTGPAMMTSLASDASGGIWIGTWGAGLLRFDPASVQTRQIRADPDRPSALPSDQILDVSLDAVGTLWAATTEGAAYRVPTGAGRRLTHQSRDAGSLSNRRVTSLLSGGEGLLWVGTRGGGLNRCEVASGRCEAIRSAPLGPLCHDDVRSLARDESGGIWVSTDGGGSCRYDPVTGAVTAATGTPYAYATLPVRPSQAWTATGQSGLLMPDGGAALTDVRVYALAPRAGGVWAGTLGRGLCAVDADGQARCLPVGDGGTLGAWITALAPGTGGMWAGGPSGLDWIPDVGTPQAILTQATLQDPSIGCVLADPSGTWVGTAEGLFVLDPTTGEITQDASAAGLSAGEGVAFTSCVRAGRDLLALGSDNGVWLVRPADMLARRPVRIRLTSLIADGRDVAPGTPPSRLRSVTFRPDQGGPTFRFATLGETFPGARRYEYRLDGYDAGWSAATRVPEAVYPKLPPGRYAFQVRPAFRPDVAPATVALIVLTPLWRRPWVVTLAMLLGLALGTLLYRARVRSLIRLERTRHQIADDLHDDVGSRLGGLALALDVAARRLPTDSRGEVIARADETRALLGDLRDAVWVVDGTSSTLADLAKRARLAAEAIAQEVPVWFDAVGPLDIQLQMSERRHLLLLVKEAVHNAVRHGQPTAIRLRVANEDGAVRIEVSDDGDGMRTPNVEGHGMRSLRRRADAVAGTLMVESHRGGGTHVELCFQPAAWARWRDRVRL